MGVWPRGAWDPENRTEKIRTPGGLATHREQKESFIEPNTRRMKLKAKVAVVTGGNSGIGLAIAQALAREGAQVVIFGRNETSLYEATRSIGGQTLAVQGDVARLADLDRLYETTAAQHGRIDILVASAGNSELALMKDTDEAFFDKLSGTNFKGVYFTVQKAVPHLNTGASVILISSIANANGSPKFSVYAATKAAVRSLARSFSAELLPRGIRVNTLSPGPIATPIFGRMNLSGEEQRKFKEQVTAHHPMGRFGQPEEVARAAVFLASSDSSYIAGAELVVDGGMSQL